MEAMANPKKTAAVYFAMAEAKNAADGHPLSDQDLAEAEELCRALEQESLTAGELQAVECLARKGHAEITPAPGCPCGSTIPRSNVGWSCAHRIFRRLATENEPAHTWPRGL
jgi:hypothetical protein